VVARQPVAFGILEGLHALGFLGVPCHAGEGRAGL
jgi:hypothetical protein